MTIITFEREGFRLYTRPKHNKKERRHLGLPKDRPVVIQVASGFVMRKGKRIKIIRTAEIVKSFFDKDTGYLVLDTDNGKRYRVQYKDVEGI